MDPETDLRCPKELRSASQWGCPPQAHSPGSAAPARGGAGHPRRESRGPKTARSEKEASPRRPREAVDRTAPRAGRGKGRGQEAAHPASLRPALRGGGGGGGGGGSSGAAAGCSAAGATGFPAGASACGGCPATARCPTDTTTDEAALGHGAPPPGFLPSPAPPLPTPPPPTAFSHDTRHGTGAHWH